MSDVFIFLWKTTKKANLSHLRIFGGYFLSPKTETGFGWEFQLGSGEGSQSLQGNNVGFGVGFTDEKSCGVLFFSIRFVRIRKKINCFFGSSL